MAGRCMREFGFYQEAMDEGRKKALRESIGIVLETRFSSEIAAEFQDALKKIENLRLLHNVFSLAIRCRRRTEFRRWFTAPEEALKQIPPPYLRARKKADHKAQSRRKRS